MKTTNLNLDITNENEKILDWIEKVNKGNDTIIDNYAAGLDTNTTSLSLRVNALESKGKFLSLWNSTTGLPITNPGSTPYNYSIGDYYIISVIGESNYMPSGESYSGIASTTPGRAEAAVGGIYYYEGEGSWNLQRSKITMPSTPSKAGTYKLACDVDRYGAVNYKWQTHINTLDCYPPYWSYDGREQSGVGTFRVYTPQPEHELVYENYGYTLTGIKTAKDVGSYPLYLTGIGDYYGTTTVYWGIQERNISYTTATLGPSITYNSFQQTQTISEITDRNGYGDVWTLTSDEWEFDNTTSDKNYGVAAGTYTLRIAGKGNYKDYKRIDWTIAALDLSTTSGSAWDSTYTGSGQYPSILIQAPNAGVRYLPNTDYTYNGDRQTNAGVYNIQIDANSANCTGSLEMSWTIKKADLAVNVTSKAVPVGGSEPTWTLNYTGLLGSDTSAVVSGTPTYTYIDTSLVEHSFDDIKNTAGKYLVKVSGLTANNYNVSTPIPEETSQWVGTLTVKLPDYLSFCSPSSLLQITLERATGSGSYPTIYYSKDRVTWTQYSTFIPIYADPGQRVYLKGDNSTFSSSSTTFNFNFSGGASDVEASGEVISLIDSSCSITTAVPDYCFAKLFYNNLWLVKAPKLSATTVGAYAYQQMFYGCTNLTTPPPSLDTYQPNTGAYHEMFRGCTSLATPPQLRFAQASDNLCAGMFYGCTSLTTMPSLRSLRVMTNSFGYMFYGCTSLIVSSTKTTAAPNTWQVPAQGGTYSYFAYTQGYVFTDCAGTRSSDNMLKSSYHIYYTQNPPV